MSKVWLIIAIAVFILTTYQCIVSDYRQWMYYYIIVFVALMMWLMKKWMMLRVQKHQAYLEGKSNEGKTENR